MEYQNEGIKQLSGKYVLVVGASRSDRKYVWKTFQDLNLKVILVDANESNHGRDHVHEFIHYNYTQGMVDEDGNHANTILQLLGERIKKLSACFSFDEQCVHLTSILCQKLGFIGLSPDVALTVQSKRKTYETLKSKSKYSNYNTRNYSPLSFLIESVSDIWKVSGLSFPAILKPECSTRSCGVHEVHSLEDCVDKFSKERNFSPEWPGRRYSSSMVLMEYFPGLIHHVEIIVYDKLLLKAFASDMGPKLPDGFKDTTTCFPTCLPEDLRNELISAAYHCCIKLGLINGVFNVEMILTQSGFKLIEINARPGSYLRCFVFRKIYAVDLYVTQALIACRIRPDFPVVPEIYAVGCFLYGSIHYQLSNSKTSKKIYSLASDKDVSMLIYENHQDLANDTPSCIHVVAVDTKSVKSAKQNLINVFKELELSSKEFDIDQLTEFFK